MEGYVKVTATDEGIGVEAKVRDCGPVDRLMLLNSFCKGINMDDEELALAIKALPFARILIDHVEDMSKEVEA